MSVIQSAVLAAFDKVPRTILRKLVVRKLGEAGVNMPSDAIDAFVEHVFAQTRENFVWEGTPEEQAKLVRLTFTEEDRAELDYDIDKALEQLPTAVKAACEHAGKKMFERIRNNWAIEGALQRYETEAFLERLEERWGEGLEYLRMILTCCRELGDKTHRRHQKSKSKRHMYRRWVLVRLHARACQVAEEIICLMENGFADGAMARWRTLYELSVIATLIADGDEDLAERYVLHDAVEVKRQADEYEEKQVPLGFAPISQRERSAIDRQYHMVITRYGSTFGHPYGWVSKHLNLRKPTFKDIQSHADRAGMSSYYKLASFNVHASARSLFFNLTAMGSDVLVAGRSNAGLLEPGERTAHTLLFITNLFVGGTHNFDKIAELNSLLLMRDQVGPALARAERQLKRDEKARRQGLSKTRGKATRRSKPASLR